MASEGPTIEVLDSRLGGTCRSVQELSLLFAVSRTLEKSFDLTDLVKPVLARLRDMMGMERGMIAIMDREEGGILLSEAIGLPKTVAAHEYFDLMQPQLMRSVDKGESVIVPNLHDWLLEQAASDDLIEALGLKSRTGLIVVPMKSDDRIIGTLSVERVHNPRLGWEADLRILVMIASIVAQAARIRQEAAHAIETLRNENQRLQEEMAQDNLQQIKPAYMIGSASSMRSVYYNIEQVATSVTTVLIRGESGTGKELVAKALHEKSERANRNFIKFNCAALPDSIIESELFGHEKGAFTGALAMRKGRFELADGGTIFLDEIGDVSPAVQVKLLRALQEREFERVGSQETKRVDVRVLAATSRDLESMIADGSFREDLYYRLNVFPIYMPPLRERKCDILLLSNHFILKR
jgi:Nif-specific regulatory protein